MTYSVSIIIPAYKEEEFLEIAVKSLDTKLKQFIDDYEIIIVLDKDPTNKTEKILMNLKEKNEKIRPVIREKKMGVGSAVILGIKTATKETCLITTAEISEDPEDLIKMIKKINEDFDLVSGNRFFNGKINGYSTKQYFANRLCNYVIKILFNIKLNDITNGVKIYKTSILKNLELKSLNFDIFAEIPIKIFLEKNTKYYEIPVSHTVRDKKFSKFNFKKEAFLFFKVVLKCWLRI